MSNAIIIGAQAPDFILEDERGTEWRLSDYRRKVVALLFYPGDETLVCTAQMCSVRDAWADYVATGAEIVGISPDPADSHRRFTAKHKLPLRLLADSDGAVFKAYCTKWWMPRRATRAVVVIDAHGIIRFHKTLLGIFRPSDTEVLTAIRLAQYDVLAARL